MRLLIDNALSPRIAAGLRDAGHDVIHVRDRGMASAPDEDILKFARDEERTIISADTDFAMLLAIQEDPEPSFVLLRPAPDKIEQQLVALVANLPRVEREIERGAVVVIEPSRVRVRRLPIVDEDEIGT